MKNYLNNLIFCTEDIVICIWLTFINYSSILKFLIYLEYFDNKVITFVLIGYQSSYMNCLQKFISRYINANLINLFIRLKLQDEKGINFAF